MIPDDVRYTEDHEWVRQEGDLYVVGISDFAQEQLGDITFVDLPDVGRKLAKHEEAAEVESVKAASDVYAPVAGAVAEVNELLETEPEKVNQDAYGDGWFFKLKNVKKSDYEALMNADAYEAYVEGLED
jgi:glycine cleavage system H protein